MAAEFQDINVSFPDGVYADVRLESTSESQIGFVEGALRQVKIRSEVGAFLRVLKEGRWYTASTTDLSSIDERLRELSVSNALSAGEVHDIDEQMIVIQDRIRSFDDEPLNEVPAQDKVALLKPFVAHMAESNALGVSVWWMDRRRDRRFLSSRGADISHDFQDGGVSVFFTLVHGEENVRGYYNAAAHRLSEVREKIPALLEELDEDLAKYQRFVEGAQPVNPGTYPVILAPQVTGVFAHESFGHKSEADFMIGDDAAMEEWTLGKTLGRDFLNIVDHGGLFGHGFVPYDDEGQPAQETYLIKNGKLSGRLHSASTAAALGEKHTGNARAMSFRFEPIVRMTSTYIQPGSSTLDELIAGIQDGFFVETCRHGSGMSTFTIAPNLAWRIQDGKVTEPVRIAVLTGSVFETLNEIDGLSDTLGRRFNTLGGCGKFEQFPLPVSMGGPYMRVAKMNVA